jgi:iron complex transport system ATP-binding protein
MLKVSNIHYQIGTKTILKNIHAHFLPNECNMIMGANGSGKSSLLKIISGDDVKYTGEVCFQEVNIKSIQKEALAKKRAVMTQMPELSFPIQVTEVILMGRYPHFNFEPTAKDAKICSEVMELMHLTAFAKRNYLTLSGGEKQRVQFARVLAQIWEKPADGSFRYLFLDEPLNNLDIKYQQQFLQIAQSFVDKNTFLIAVMHDLNLAAQFAHKIFFLKNGELVYSGQTKELLTEEIIETVFDIKPTILKHPFNHTSIVLFS